MKSLIVCRFLQLSIDGMILHRAGNHLSSKWRSIKHLECPWVSKSCILLQPRVEVVVCLIVYSLQVVCFGKWKVCYVDWKTLQNVYTVYSYNCVFHDKLSLDIIWLWWPQINATKTSIQKPKNRRGTGRKISGWLHTSVMASHLCHAIFL